MAGGIFYVVADVFEPSPEPFMVVEVNTNIPSGSGVEGVVHSLHMNRIEAERVAHELEGGSLQ